MFDGTPECRLLYGGSRQYWELEKSLTIPNKNKYKKVAKDAKKAVDIANAEKCEEL